MTKEAYFSLVIFVMSTIFMVGTLYCPIKNFFKNRQFKKEFDHYNFTTEEIRFIKDVKKLGVKNWKQLTELNEHNNPIFNKDQLDEIQKYVYFKWKINEKVDYLPIFADPKYSDKQMFQISNGLQVGIDINWLLDERLSEEQMTVIKMFLHNLGYLGYEQFYPTIFKAENKPEVIEEIYNYLSHYKPRDLKKIEKRISIIILRNS